MCPCPYQEQRPRPAQIDSGNDRVSLCFGTVHNGWLALEEARAFRPDVALLDIGMPGMSGYQVARRLREQPELRGMVLVALTGCGQEEDRRRSHEAGFDYHLTKPADRAALEKWLASLDGSR
jgi:two-component system, chemotaxis family, CheB/CheR fusion protein